MPHEGKTATAPWSSDYDGGSIDAPIGSHPYSEPSVKGVIDVGYLDENGIWRQRADSDLEFTLSNENEAVGPGATLFIDPINMLNHDKLILGLLDSSGNDINVDVRYMINGAAPVGSPYAVPFITDVGVNGAKEWSINQVNSAASDTFFNILNDLSEGLVNTWQFYKIVGLFGTLGNMNIVSNEGANPGTVSACFMRLV